MDANSIHKHSLLSISDICNPHLRVPAGFPGTTSEVIREKTMNRPSWNFVKVSCQANSFADCLAIVQPIGISLGLFLPIFFLMFCHDRTL